eukprot:1157880-Pelagomonas_calceolata.AAC.7
MCHSLSYHLKNQPVPVAESALLAFQPREAMPSSYLLSTTKVCVLDTAADQAEACGTALRPTVLPIH